MLTMLFENRNVLLCTVGTSLFDGNLKNISQSDNKPENWEMISNAYKQKNWGKLAKELIKLDPSDRICGAEINTINDIIKLKKAPLEEIYFLVSDTETGRNTGDTLKEYFTNNNPIKKVHVSIHVIEKLQDQNPKEFKIHGLRNLVREIGHIVVQGNNLPRSIIDATGGYKAQIAIAVAIGQILKIPVMYKHERFREIIDFPPLPISFDYSMLGMYADVFARFERDETLTYQELLNYLDGSEKEKKEIYEIIRVFLTEVLIPDTNETLYELSPMGQVYITAYRTQFPKPPESLKPSDNRKKPTFGDDHHYPKGFKDFINKLWEKYKWIHTIYTTDYNKQNAIHGIEFAVKTINQEKKLIGTYKNDDFGARYIIELSDTGIEALCWAADFLNRNYDRN